MLILVVPTDGVCHNRRSSYPFGDVLGATWTSQNGSKLGNCANFGYSGTVFDLLMNSKGDIGPDDFSCGYPGMEDPITFLGTLLVCLDGTSGSSFFRIGF